MHIEIKWLPGSSGISQSTRYAVGIICIMTWSKEVDGIQKNCALATVHVLECWSSDGCGARVEGDERNAGIC